MIRDETPVEVLAHNERMTRQAERHWNQQQGQGARTYQEVAVVEQVHARPLPTGMTNPLDLPQKEFKHQLQVRGENRTTLVQWLKDSLKVDIDYGRIHFVKKSECNKGAACTNPYHFTKDTLFKPGAQKICGMLGVTPTYPNLGRYEEAALSGQEIKSIILRCQIVSVDGRVIAEGVGARSLAQDWGDLNKALKMACKSAHLDATLCMAGLSEIFSHPDQPPPPAGEPEEKVKVNPAVVPSGRFAGKYWADVSLLYLQGVIASDKVSAELHAGAKAELERRPKPPIEEGFDDDIPF